MFKRERKSNILSQYNISIIDCYRCEDAEAFEVQDGGKSTGIFTKYLNKHILQTEKVTHVLEKVSEGKVGDLSFNIG